MTSFRLNKKQQQLAADNFGLVKFMAKKYAERRHINDLETLMSAGNYALCKAAFKYKPQGAKFSTYACQCIAREMKLVAKMELDINRATSVTKISWSNKAHNVAKTTHGFDIDDADIINKALMHQFIGKLTNRDYTVVRMYAHGKTLGESGAVVGIGKERARQVVNKFTGVGYRGPRLDS